MSGSESARARALKWSVDTYTLRRAVCVCEWNRQISLEIYISDWDSHKQILSPLQRQYAFSSQWYNFRFASIFFSSKRSSGGCFDKKWIEIQVYFSHVRCCCCCCENRLIHLLFGFNDHLWQVPLWPINQPPDCVSNRSISVQKFSNVISWW